jgi:hypothetical protein
MLYAARSGALMVSGAGAQDSLSAAIIEFITEFQIFGF